ncbi:hypothetical protein POM88_033672 [Heracleum sosnowskyi]|uniref:Uncharacterized protein n=1 Tax=Heracleum sosnowskyi TaxID=360622 RepID=A0AAD8HHU2_9APIA|nr:hypothetical protein POM88_033672 [Heracleum sosnowskyi]
MMMEKNKKRRLVTEQDIEAALQLIHLKNCHQNFIASDQNLPCQKIHEPFMKIVVKSKEFLRAQDINRNNKKIICSRKRKSDSIASCSSCITFDLDDKSDEDANEVVGSVKKMNKFRSIVDIYNVTKPL